MAQVQIRKDVKRLGWFAILAVLFAGFNIYDALASESHRGFHLGLAAFALIVAGIAFRLGRRIAHQLTVIGALDNKIEELSS